MSKLVREKLAWRDAATLIVIAKKKLKILHPFYKAKSMLSWNDVTDYLLLTLQRHSRSSFMVCAQLVI